MKEENKNNWLSIVIITILLAILIVICYYFLKTNTNNLQKEENDNHPSSEQNIKEDDLSYYEFEYPDDSELDCTKNPNPSKIIQKKYNLDGTEVNVNIETRIDAGTDCDEIKTYGGSDGIFKSFVTINGKKYDNSSTSEDKNIMAIQKLDNNYIMLYAWNGSSGGSYALFINKNGDVSKKIYYNASTNTDFKINKDKNNKIISFTYYLNNCNGYKDRIDLTYSNGIFGKSVQTATNIEADGEVIGC